MSRFGATSLSLAVISAAAIALASGVPEQLNYQARVESAGVPFDGVGLFKFAIVDDAGTTTYWSNDGTSSTGDAPAAAVSLNVVGGLLNVMLGDASHANMQPIPAAAFSNPDANLRVWFGGAAGTTYERLVPDSKLGSAPYAMMAETVPDASIHGEKLARESVWPVHEGRNNTIVSYFASYTATTISNVATIATNKNFIITDIIYGSQSATEMSADVRISYTKDSVQTILLVQKSTPWADSGGGALVVPTRMAMKSGLVVPAGATLEIGGWIGGWNWPKSCSVSGFEIPVGGP